MSPLCAFALTCVVAQAELSALAAPPVSAQVAPPKLEGATVWRGESVASAPAECTDRDARTWGELDPGAVDGELRVGFQWSEVRTVAGITLDFLSLDGVVFEAVPGTQAVEVLADGLWYPVAARLTRDDARQGELAHYQQHGGVVWRLALARRAVQGVRVVLRRTANASLAWRRYVLRELSCFDDPDVPVEQAVSGNAVANTLEKEREGARAKPSDDETLVNLADPKNGAERVVEEEALLISWPRPRYVDEVEVAGREAPMVEWWDGTEFRLAFVTNLELINNGDNGNGDEGSEGSDPRAVTRFAPIATTRLQISDCDLTGPVAVRLGTDAARTLTERRRSNSDRFLDELLDGASDPDFADVAAWLLPLDMQAAVLGRPGDRVETLVTWNGTLHETEHAEAGAWISGAAQYVPGRAQWVDRFVAFAADGELFGADPDRTLRSAWPDGRPGVTTRHQKEGLLYETSAFVTVTGDPVWARVVTLRIKNPTAETRRASMTAILGRRRHPAAARGELELAPLPTGYRCEESDRTVRDAEGNVVLRASEPGAWSENPLEPTLTYSVELGAGESREFHLVLPSLNAPTKDAAAVAALDVALSRERFESYWENLFSAVELELPEPPLNDLWHSLVAQALIVLEDEDRLKYGAYVYEDYFGLEEGWPAVALAQFGQTAAAERACERMLAPDLLDPTNYHHQYRAGLAAVSAAHVARLSHESGFVARVRPRLQAVAEWIVASRHAGDEAGGEFVGLLPKHAYGGDVTTPARSLYSNAACWRGLHEIASLLEGADETAGPLSRESIAYREQLTSLVQAVADRATDPPFVPMAVDLGDEGTEAWRRVEPAYPFLPDDAVGNYWSLFAPLFLETELFPAGSDVATWIRDYLAGHGGTLLGLARFHGGVDPIYGLGQAQSLALAGEGPRFRATAWSFLAHGLARDFVIGGEVTGVFPLRTSNAAWRARFEQTRWHWNLYFADGGEEEFGRAIGSEPLSASAGVGLQLLRRLLIEELPGNAEIPPGSQPLRALHLLRLAPPGWLRDGRTLHFAHLPTEFGPVSLTLESHVDSDGVIVGHIDPPRNGGPPPAQLVLWLNHPDGFEIQKVTVDGELWADFRDNWVLLPTDRAVEFRVEY